MDDRESLIYPNLHDYFITQGNIYKILPIINREKKKSSVSLSLLDWFVTNYSKKYGTSYILNKKKFDVFIEYKAQLTDYGKKYFDPFNRSGPILCLEHSVDKKSIYTYTTFKQLNFLKWALKNKIIKHVEDNIEHISNDYQQAKNMRKNKIVKTIEPKPKIKNDDKNITVNISKLVIKFNRK